MSSTQRSPKLEHTPRAEIDRTEDVLDALSILIGIKNSVVARDFAARILGHFGADCDVTGLTVDQLMSVPGIGRIRARRIHAAGLLARIYHSAFEHDGELNAASALVEWLRALVPPKGSALVAHTAHPGDAVVRLALDEPLHSASPIGHYLMPLMAHRTRPWSITYIRGAGKPTPHETQCAVRIIHVAGLFGIRLSSLSVLGGHVLWPLN